MVAYSFKQQFAAPILAGVKRQTIRADRKRHAREGEELQLYTGMRTRHCALVGRSFCRAVWPIMLVFDENPEDEGIVLPGLGYPGGLDQFARDDGFAGWPELKVFWAENHPGVDRFEGVLIQWGPLL